MNDKNELPAKSDDSSDTLMLILAYLGPLGLIPYLMDQGEDVKWHAKQGLTLTGVWIVIWICFSIPVFGWLFILLAPFLSLAVLAIVIVAIIRATKGERWRIPLIADLADKW